MRCVTKTNIQIMYCFYALNDINSDNYAVFAFFQKLLYNNNKSINEKKRRRGKTS